MGEILNATVDWWLKWAFGLIAAGIAWCIHGVKKKQIAQDARQNAIEVGVLALLRGEIIRAYDKYSERGSITLHGLEAIEKMYAAYSGLGGNGTVPRLMEFMRGLEVKDK